MVEYTDIIQIVEVMKQRVCRS